MTHGTRSCYQTGCRRLECVEANRSFARDHKRQKIRPDGDGLARIGVTEVRNHIAFLRSNGFTFPEIARRAGVHHRTLRLIAHRRSKWIARARADRILGIGIGIPDEFCEGLEEWHGSLYGYRVKGCKGPECRRAEREYQRAKRSRAAS